MAKYIRANNLTPKLPIIPGLVFWLSLDHWQAPAWGYGVVGALWAIWLVASVVRIFKDDEVDIFETKIK